jgi:hypothetical protein
MDGPPALIAGRLLPFPLTKGGMGGAALGFLAAEPNYRAADHITYENSDLGWFRMCKSIRPVAEQALG